MMSTISLADFWLLNEWQQKVYKMLGAMSGILKRSACGHQSCTLKDERPGRLASIYVFQPLSAPVVISFSRRSLSACRGTPEWR
mmetsp:Transcript_34600/g.72817  ORF Transcript_34600/g.72817 Transcript_34600/m.72817 type:complete len:84 (+) Transcript_34600:308-559(+)